MTAYYNEIEPFAAEWLRALIAAGHIAPGDVDTRSIVDVRPDDLRGYTQCHFFAGIGVWSYALRRAGWDDTRPIWTGSCPCQPFSAAGKGGGFDDERHLWPHWHYLISECRPAVVAGEQVASKDGLAWLDLVQADLEGSGYACGAVDTCSAGSGAPHIRQRLRFVAENQLEHAESDGRQQGRPQSSGWRTAGGRCAGELAYSVSERGCSGELGRQDTSHAWQSSEANALAYTDGDEPRAGRDAGRAQGEGLGFEPGGRGAISIVADPESVRQQRRSLRTGPGLPTNGASQDGISGIMADADINRFQGRSVKAVFGKRRRDEGHAVGRGGASLVEPAPGTGPTNGHWRDADWLFCRDGKWRAVEPGTFPLVNGAPARVGRLRGYGNAVDAEATKIFIEAYLDTTGDKHFRLNDIFA